MLPGVLGDSPPHLAYELTDPSSAKKPDHGACETYRRPEVQHCLRELLAVDAVPVERWLSVLEQVGSISDVWELLAKLACNVTLNYSSETAGSPVDELCPALKYSERKEEDCWSWIKVLRLRVLLATTKWEKLSQRSENEQRDILNKVRNAYFAGVLSNVNWKDNDLVQTYAERWSLLFTCWEALQRGSRLAVMKRLLSDSDLKSLRKWSARIIAGKTNVDGVVVERALAFYLKYLINDIDTTRTVEDLIDWKVLIYLQQKGVHLDAVELQLSVDKVVELLLCAEEVELTAETFAVVEKLLSSRLKDRGSEIVGG
ncbi:unnamed protein product [Heligmosomoides polygyrus]|uniref:Nuclear pore complex protein n=1 Tax=Heligmosomoides polygyrus TaxID=6339 RepID=A0A183GCV5_HELPZ|nr:unnamed protein product [Heligmosomoides polygyrus]